MAVRKILTYQLAPTRSGVSFLRFEIGRIYFELFMAEKESKLCSCSSAKISRTDGEREVYQITTEFLLRCLKISILLVSPP